MNLVSQPDPSACSDEQHNVEVQDKIDTEQDHETQNIGINQYNTPAPTPRAERDDDQINNDGALVLKNRSPSIPTTRTEETFIANHQVTTPAVKPDCIATNLPFGVNSALPVRIDHPSMRTSGTALPSSELFEPPPASENERTTHATQVGDSDDENAFVTTTATSATKEPALGVEVLMDRDCLETHEDGELSTVVLVDKGKGVDPREYGGALCDPKSMLIPTGTTSASGSDFIELVGVHRDKGKSVDPKERGNGMAKYKPGPSRIDFHDDKETILQAILLKSFKPTKKADLNHEPPYDPTLPRPRWYPKISPYRLIVFSTPLAIGTIKAVLSQKGRVTTPITLEWISSVVVFLVLFLLGCYETRRDMPKYLSWLSWLFKPDCVDVVWYLAAKLSIQRPEYLSDERDVEFDPGAFVTLHRILVSTAVAFLGSLKTQISLYSNGSPVPIWLEWFLSGLVLSALYLLGLYEYNSVGLLSSFFRQDCSHEKVLNLIPIIGVSAFFLVIYGFQVVPGLKQIPPNYFEEYTTGRDIRIPLGPTLSKGAVEDFHLVVLIYIPCIILLFLCLVPLIASLLVAILALTSMLPSVLQYHNGRFFGPVERLPKRRPVNRIIYHFIAFIQLLLFVGLNIWIYLFYYFGAEIAGRRLSKYGGYPQLSKIVLYPTMVIVLVYVWTISATGKLGEMRWWPSRDRLSRLVPPSIKNATMTKFIQRQMKALRRRLRSSSLKHLNVLAWMLCYICLTVVYFSIPHALLVDGTDSELIDLVSTVISSIALLPCIAILLIVIPFIVKYCHDVTSREPTKTTNLNDGLPYDPTLPRPRWHPKISPYRFISFLTPLVIGTVKAVLSLKGSVTPITLEWIFGLVFLVLFHLGWYETRKAIPKYLLWLFKPDCLDVVWYLAAKLSIQRPEYSSNECDDPTASVTSYRILVSTSVVFLGSLKIIFTGLNLLTNAIWVQWFLAGLILSLFYFIGLYKNNSLGRWSSFFRKDSSHLFHMDSVTSFPMIVSFAFFSFFYSALVLPSLKWIPLNYFEEYTRDFQLPIGPTLSKDTVEQLHLVVVIYIPSIILFFLFLAPLILGLWEVPFLTLTSIFPSVIRSHTGRFVGTIQRFFQIRPIDRIIYHFIAFVQLLLFVGCHIWIFLFICFFDVFAERTLMRGDLYHFIKNVLYLTMVTALIYVWIIAATSRLGEMRWWSPRDRLSRLVPPSIKNATMTKFIQRQVKALRHLDSFGPSDSYASLFLRGGILCGMGPLMVFSCLLPIFSKEIDPAQIVLVNIYCLFFLVPLSIPCVWVFWLFRLGVGFGVIPGKVPGPSRQRLRIN